MDFEQPASHTAKLLVLLRTISFFCKYSLSWEKQNIQLPSESWQLLWTVLKLYRQSGISYDDSREYFKTPLRSKENKLILKKFVVFCCSTNKKRRIPYKATGIFFICDSLQLIQVFVFTLVMLRFSLEVALAQCIARYALPGTTLLNKLSSLTLKMADIVSRIEHPFKILKLNIFYRVLTFTTKILFRNFCDLNSQND